MEGMILTLKVKMWTLKREDIGIRIEFADFKWEDSGCMVEGKMEKV